MLIFKYTFIYLHSIGAPYMSAADRIATGVSVQWNGTGLGDSPGARSLHPPGVIAYARMAP